MNKLYSAHPNNNARWKYYTFSGAYKWCLICQNYIYIYTPSDRVAIGLQSKFICISLSSAVARDVGEWNSDQFWSKFKHGQFSTGLWLKFYPISATSVAAAGGQNSIEFWSNFGWNSTMVRSESHATMAPRFQAPQLTPTTTIMRVASDRD